MDRKTEKGTLSVHDEVIQALVEATTLDVAGVVGMASRGLGEEVGGWIARGNRTRGVAVSYGSAATDYAVDVYITAAFHTPFRDLARTVGSRVGEALADALGVAPILVRVHVEGVEPA